MSCSSYDDGSENSIGIIGTESIILKSNDNYESSKKKWQPNDSLLFEVKSELLNFTYFNDLNQYLDNTQAKVLWAWSVIDAKNSSEYILHTPIVKEKQIIGVLRFTNDFDHSHFDFIDVEEFRNKISLDSDFSLNDSDILYLFKLLDFQIICNNEFNEFLLAYISGWQESNKHRLESRLTGMLVDIPLYSSGYDNWGYWRVRTGTQTIAVILPCAPSSGGGSPVSSSSGGGNSTNNIFDILPDDCKNEMSFEAIRLIREFENLEFPCDDKNEILNNIINSICSGYNDGENWENQQGSLPIGGNIGSEEVIETLSEYDGISLNIYNNLKECNTDEEICNLISENPVISTTCEDDRISCESFEFEDFGDYQVSQLEGVEFNFSSTSFPGPPPIPASVKECDFDVETYVLTNFNVGGTDYSINGAMAAQAAARAISEAQQQVVLAVGALSRPNFRNLDCDKIGDLFSTAYNLSIKNEVSEIVSSTYNVNAGATNEDYNESEISLGFEELGITPTSVSSDWFGEDQCWN